jgi:hypothetical protein
MSLTAVVGVAGVEGMFWVDHDSSTDTKNSSAGARVAGTTTSSGMTSQYVACLQSSGVSSDGAGGGTPTGFWPGIGPNSFSTVWFSATRMAAAD